MLAFHVNRISSWHWSHLKAVKSVFTENLKKQKVQREDHRVNYQQTLYSAGKNRNKVSLLLHSCVASVFWSSHFSPTQDTNRVNTNAVVFRFVFFFFNHSWLMTWVSPLEWVKGNIYATDFLDTLRATSHSMGLNSWGTPVLGTVCAWLYKAICLAGLCLWDYQADEPAIRFS